MLPDVFDMRLFKDPNKFLDAITNEKPDLVALSNYIWNKNLQLEFAKYIKMLHPDCITVMGGPNYNFSEATWIEQFARKNRQIDFHIEGEGESKFYNVAACCVVNDFDLSAVMAANLAGATFIDPCTDRLIVNGLMPAEGLWSRLEDLNLDRKNGRLRDLDDVPSPYLTGLLDEFLADPNFCPIIETNRGCPYACTFCDWGAMSKSSSAMFSTERVVEELRYIAEHNVCKTSYLYIGDANFGLFKRDIEFARLLRELKDSRGFPQNVYMYFAKNSSEKVVRIAEILKDMTPISLSRQTQNEEVLKIIKRSNISTDTFNSVAALAKSLGIDSYVELIYTLPGESKKSFYAGVREVMKQNTDSLHMFPAMLLDGSEMGTQASRTRYGLKGEWRWIDGCAGSYGPVNAIEFEEIIASTKVMSREDYMEVRLFHFLQALFLDTKIYKDVEVLLGDLLIFDLIMDIIANYHSAPGPLRELIDDFIYQANAEFVPEPSSHFTKAEVERRFNTSVKLNPLFIAKLLYDTGVRKAFHVFLKERVSAIGNATEREIDGVIEFIDASVYPFDGSLIRDITMHFDAVAFANRPPFQRVKASGYLSERPRIFRYRKPITYMQFIGEMDKSLPLSKKVYEVLLHHTHETFRYTLLNRLEDEITDFAVTQAGVPAGHGYGDSEKRIIRLEDGWLY
jgi:radical SAM superfamily enzyme YgiQ (UPF0313 family)